MMKKLLLALALAVPATTFASDIAAGAIEVKGGSKLSFGSTTAKPDGGDKSTDTTIALDAGAAYYLTPSFGVGLELSYEHTTTKETGLPSETFSAISIGPKAVYEIGLAPQTSAFVEGMVGISKADIAGFEVDGWGFGLGAGVKYFFSRSVSGNVGLNYSLNKFDSNGLKTDVSNLALGFGLSAYFGNAAH